MRKLLMGIFLFTLVGTGTELLLLEHFDGWDQLIPLILMSAALVVLGWYALSRDAASLKFFRVLMVVFMFGGLLGLVLHYRGNALFELDVAPEMHGFELFWKSITGATPALAPGTMIQLGLIGWVYTFRHPLLTRNNEPKSERSLS